MDKVADKEELLQLLTPSGEQTGVFEYRSVVHQKGLYHQEIGVIPVNNKGEVLLQRRSKNKKSYPNCWGLCAGHVVEKQSTTEAAVMEVNEELGLSINENDLKILVNKTKNERNDNKCFATCFYVLTDKLLDFFKKQDEEVEELKWFSIDEFEDLIISENNCIFKNNKYYRLIIKNLKQIVDTF
ncbi:MAG: NUDIX domain-containing protein [Clostridiales bacterium]|nr:NUDIX domain-containing protein [Clostridiales bacterium]